jgi:uncharacterized protein with GYD domain
VATYIVQGRFTADAVKGMIRTPEDRTGPISELCEALGGKLISWYMTTGDYDWLLIVEGPRPEDTMVATIVAAAGGGVTNLKTISAFSAQEAKAMFAKAGGLAPKFKSAGQGG